MTTYAVTAQVITHDGDYTGSRSVPTFYLDSRVQGITSKGHAVSVAADILNPLGTINSADLRIHVEPAGQSESLTWEAAHAYLTGWHAMGDSEARELLIQAEMHRHAVKRLAGRTLRVAWSGSEANSFHVTSE